MFNVFGFYKFKRINNLNKIKILLYPIFLDHKIRGTLILSREGINGTISGKKNDIIFFSKIIFHFFFKNILQNEFVQELIGLSSSARGGGVYERS